MVDGKCEVRRMKLDDLTPASYNPRVISEDAYDGLGESINNFGLLSLIVWNETTGNIVGGHQRYKKLKEEGETETDVVVVNLDENEEVALNIALNNRQIRGDFSKEVLDSLRETEAQIGSLFNDLKLNDLHTQLQKYKWEKDDKKEKKEKDNNNDDSGSNGFTEMLNDDTEESDTVIICPECGSMWQMSNNKVIYNAKTEQEPSNPLGNQGSQPE